MKFIFSNCIKIEKRYVERMISFGVKEKSGEAFQIDNSDIRQKSLGRYEINERKGYCVCQMCREAFDKRHMQANSILKEPNYYWQGCDISLCLMCSAHFKELRDNKTILKRFHDEIRKTNADVNHPIFIKIGNDTIVFGQKHLAEIQEILKSGKE